VPLATVVKMRLDQFSNRGFDGENLAQHEWWSDAPSRQGLGARPSSSSVRLAGSSLTVSSWPGAGAAIIEIGATLPTPNLPMSTSGMERVFRIALCRQSV
jgi:hypothetical protein